MTWALLLLFGLVVLFLINSMVSGRRRRAPNVLDKDGWPKPENRSGFQPNDEE